MKASNLLAVVVALAFAVQTPSQTAPKSNLQQRVEGLEQQVKALQEQVNQLSGDMAVLKLQQTAYDSVTFDLSTPGHYQKIDTSDGFFLVSTEGVEPYLDGYQITLDIGNPTTATYRGFTIHAKWSKAYDFGHYDAASYDKWNKSVQQKDITYTDALASGTWNKVQVILTPVSRDGLGYFEISLDTNTVSLAQQ